MNTYSDYFRSRGLPALTLWLVISSSGCKMMSKAAYSVGSYLDPDQVACVDHVGHCELCGDSGEVIQDGSVHPVDYEMSGVTESHAVKPPYDLSGEVQEIRAATLGFRKELDAVNTRLATRGQALIKTRAQLARVQSDVGELRSDLSQWQSSMRNIHRQINERDAERLATLSEMAASLKSVISENARR